MAAPDTTFRLLQIIERKTEDLIKSTPLLLNQSYLLIKTLSQRSPGCLFCSYEDFGKNKKQKGVAHRYADAGNTGYSRCIIGRYNLISSSWLTLKPFLKRRGFFPAYILLHFQRGFQR
jgi:hypothetical protein